MATETKLIPSGSQTVGPYFHIGLKRLIDEAPEIDAGAIEICGRVIDRDGTPVPDAMLEFWCPNAATRDYIAGFNHSGFPSGFRRSATDQNGSFSVLMPRPAEVVMEKGEMPAPHMLVLVFARGLLRHLLSRVYFERESGNATDPVLLTVPAERRHTLIARPDESKNNLYRWDVILQGPDETVFFAW
jgi:protocatechuate 3,4-dioxygenase, alpha subunit